jgi:hypothetical protein
MWKADSTIKVAAGHVCRICDIIKHLIAYKMVKGYRELPLVTE